MAESLAHDTVIVDDVEAHHERSVAEAVTILMPPTDHPCGLRAYAAIDVGGHLEFARVLRVADPAAWGATRLE